MNRMVYCITTKTPQGYSCISCNHNDEIRDEIRVIALHMLNQKNLLFLVTTIKFEKQCSKRCRHFGHKKTIFTVKTASQSDKTA